MDDGDVPGERTQVVRKRNGWFHVIARENPLNYPDVKDDNQQHLSRQPGPQRMDDGDVPGEQTQVVRVHYGWFHMMVRENPFKYLDMPIMTVSTIRFVNWGLGEWMMLMHWEMNTVI